MMNRVTAIDFFGQICADAEKRNVMPARIVIESGNYNPVGAASYWPQPTLSSSIDVQLPDAIDIVQEDSLLGAVSNEISKAIQFPVNTIFAHGLGIIASAMSKSFSFEYGQSRKPVNLYVVTAQPPSTGKSGVNEILSEPVHSAFESINKTAAVEIKKNKIQYANLKNEAKQAQSDPERFALEDEMTSLLKKRKNHIVYTYALDDATPEAVAKIALNQNGLFNIISAEADAINIILGGVYSDRKANFGVFLKGWDYERHQVARANQPTMSGHVVGNIAVIAQDESIKTILAAGESGRGISERFLLVRESTYLGRRTFGERRKINDDILAQYGNMIFNIVREKKVDLKISDKSIEMINKYRRRVEPDMADEGRYSNNMMRGFIGKADKQILKIACILHAIENWRDGGNRSERVCIKHVVPGIDIFERIVDAYTHAADDLGFTGAESEYKKVEERLTTYAEKGKISVTVSQLRSSIKDVKPFTGTPNLTAKLRDHIFPVLELNGICVVHNSKIYINPHLKG